MNGSLEDRFDTRSIDSGKLNNHFRRLTDMIARNGDSLGLDNDKIDRLRELRKKTSQYDPQILKKRNLLGHVREKKGPEGWTLEGGRIRSTDFPELRRTFTEYNDSFRGMIEIIETLNVKQSE